MPATGADDDGGELVRHDASVQEVVPATRPITVPTVMPTVVIRSLPARLGTALIGLQLGRASDFDGLVERMNASRIDCRHLKPGTPEYEFVVS